MLEFNTGGPPTVNWEEALGNRVVEVPARSSVCEQEVALQFNLPSLRYHASP